MFKLPCMGSFESLHGSDWPLFNKRFTVTVGCTWCLPLSRPNRAMQRLKTNHAWQFKHEVWVRKVKIKKYCKIPELYPVKRGKKRKNWKNEINRWTRCGKMILKKGEFSLKNDFSFCYICSVWNSYSFSCKGLRPRENYHHTWYRGARLKKAASSGWKYIPQYPLLMKLSEQKYIRLK